jgi:hypothetical protein
MQLLNHAAVIFSLFDVLLATPGKTRDFARLTMTGTMITNHRLHNLCNDDKYVERLKEKFSKIKNGKDRTNS